MINETPITDQSQQQQPLPETPEAPVATVETKSMYDQPQETPTFSDGAKKIKVLNISYDRLIFDPESPVRQRVLEYGELFNELHIIIFTLKKHNFEKQRIADNIWVYPTNSLFRVLYAYDAVRVAKKDLTFRSNLRADIVSTQDPFEAGYAGLKIARLFDRRLQLQVHSDFLSPYFKDMDRLNVVRIMMAKRILPHANCVRVVSKHMKEAIEERFPTLKGRVDILPIYIDIPFFQNAEAKFDVQKRYPQFNFTILMVNRLTKEKNIAFAIEVLAGLIKTYSKIGLIIVGEGREQAHLEALAKKRGVENSVIFEPWQHDVVSFYKTCNLFLLTSTYEGYGRGPIEAAASGIPVVTSDVGITASIFKEKETAFICPVNDFDCFTQKIRSFIEHNEERIFFKFNVKEHIETLVSGSKGEYLRRFKEGMEMCLAREL